MHVPRSNTLCSTSAHGRRGWFFALLLAILLAPWLHSAFAGGAASLEHSVAGFSDTHAGDCASRHQGDGPDRRRDAPSPDDGCCCPFCENASLLGFLPTSGAPAMDRVPSIAPSRIQSAPFAPRAPVVFAQPRAPPAI
ncbi:DUF2946 family protein [Methylosinus sp. Ce-a6]|uniref:DUF2946 family protein n=1 Tax=Methylosinus sp. Ce-a6 TaxID=2172005 RepID=UPI0034D4EA95